MTAACMACGSDREPQTLTQIRSREREATQLVLCSRCLETRTARTWTAAEAKTLDLQPELERHAGTGEGPLTYFRDEGGGVRLLRLQNDWLERKAKR